MLQKKIQDTIGLIEVVVDNRNIATENDNVAKRNNSFFDSFDKLKPTVLSYFIAKKHFNFTLSENTYLQMKELMEYSKNTFNEARAVNPDAFRKKSDVFIDNISKEWSDFFHKTNSELINGLNIMLLVHSAPQTVRSCISNLKKCEKWPMVQEVVDGYISSQRTAHELLKEMHFDDDIKVFLDKVRMKTATLTDLTPSILEWINSENISDKISLSIKII